MACNYTLAGIAKGCKDNLGGIKEVYIANYSDITAKPTLGTGDQITGITISTGVTFKTFAFRKQTGALTTTPTISDENGTTFFQSELNMKFNKLETSKRLEIISLALGDVVCIVRDQNDKLWYLGYDNPVTLSAGSISTGTAMGDFAGYDVTLMDMAKLAPYEVTMNIDTITDGNHLPW